MTSNRVKESIGINVVRWTVEVEWESGWQEYAQQNDDAIDGVILMRRGTKKPSDTGGIVFVQVKCGGNGYRQDQVQYPSHLCITLGKNYIDAHRPRWMKVPGPATLIFVDDTVNKFDPPAWWADLKASESYSPTNAGVILVPKTQKFAHHTKGEFHKLCRSGPADRTLEELRLDRADSLLPKLGKAESLRDDAWAFYKSWRADPSARRHSSLGEVLVNRVGWKHMTRRGRLPERIVQSWLLLGAARAMVSNCRKVFNLGHAKQRPLPDGNTEVIDYLGIRARVVFSYRHNAVIQVVLRRSRLLSPSNRQVERQKIWFYSVYELRRGMGIV
jgi:Domain of unknown function (DUF4365)